MGKSRDKASPKQAKLHRTMLEQDEEAAVAAHCLASYGIIAAVRTIRGLSPRLDEMEHLGPPLIPLSTMPPHTRHLLETEAAQMKATLTARFELERKLQRAGPGADDKAVCKVVEGMMPMLRSKIDNSVADYNRAAQALIEHGGTQAHAYALALYPLIREAVLEQLLRDAREVADS